MNQLPGLCVCALAAALYVEGGRAHRVQRPVAAAPAAVVSAPAEAPLPALAPATLGFRRGGEPLRVERTDRRVRVEAADATWVLRLDTLELGRLAPEGALLPVTVQDLAAAGWKDRSALALAGLSSAELYATRATGRVEHAFGLAFEERRSHDADGPTVWWSAELGAPLRVERAGSRLELVEVGDAPAGALVAAPTRVRAPSGSAELAGL